ncbi:MAG: molybdate ABC transporter substrate-binding protein [Actinomycetota bacterium]
MRLVALALSLLVAAAGCAREEGEASLTVFAASSLSAAFEEVVAAFGELHPEVDVVLSLAGSHTLATQITHGARPDVFASADRQQMDRAVAAVPADVGPVRFATNRLAIVVQADNPRGVEGLEDLARDDVVVVLGAEEVPVGRYARRALAAAGVRVEAASAEPNVGLVLAKVGLGEADAGIVYASDLARAGEEVDGVQIPAEENVEAIYPIAGWTAGSPLARDFVEFVTSPRGRRILSGAGLGT